MHNKCMGLYGNLAVKESGALRYVKLVAWRLASLVYHRTSKVYYLAARLLDNSLVTFNVYRTSKVYYLAR